MQLFTESNLQKTQEVSNRIAPFSLAIASFSVEKMVFIFHKKINSGREGVGGRVSKMFCNPFFSMFYISIFANPVLVFR